MADNTNSKVWQEAAAAGKDCLPLEVLEKFIEGKPAEAKAAAHLAGCARCQTELSLLKDFEATKPSADEGAAVAWIAAELRRRQGGAAAQSSAARISFWRTLFRVPYLAGAAALAAVLVLAISLYNSGSGPGPINGPDYGTTYRSGEVKLLGPAGDQAQTPNAFRWEAVQGAASYKVELTDALGSFLAGATSTQPQLAATPEMKAAMQPGMPIKWKVTALDSSGKNIAESSGGNFKIR